MIDESKTLMRNPEFIGTQIDGEFVLLSIESGKYFLIKNAGTSIWESFEQPNTVAAVVTRMLEDYDIGAEQCLSEVSAFVKELYGKHILIEAAA
jgi:hypothetical protein